jgi:hypothetical protein
MRPIGVETIRIAITRVQSGAVGSTSNPVVRFRIAPAVSR